MPLTEKKPETTSRSILRLPNELLLRIYSDLPKHKDRNSLARTSRFFHDLLNPLLYSSSTIGDWATRHGKVETLRRCIEYGLDIGVDKQTGCPRVPCILLAEAAQLGVPSIIRLLVANGVDVNQDVHDVSYRRAALHGAVRIAPISQVLPTVITLVECGAEVNQSGRLGFTPLHEAMMRIFMLEYRNPAQRPVLWDTIMFLLEHGADPTIEDSYGVSPIDMAERWERDGQRTACLFREYAARYVPA